MPNKQLKKTKYVVSTLTQTGVSLTIGGLIRNNMPRSSNPAIDLILGAAAFCAGYFVASAANEQIDAYVCKSVDKVANAITQ